MRLSRQINSRMPCELVRPRSKRARSPKSRKTLPEIFREGRERIGRAIVITQNDGEVTKDFWSVPFERCGRRFTCAPRIELATYLLLELRVDPRHSPARTF